MIDLDYGVKYAMPKAYKRLLEHRSFTWDKEEILISRG
jgi:hypothetical protein